MVTESREAVNVFTAEATAANVCAGAAAAASGAIAPVAADARAPIGRDNDPITGIADRMISSSTLLSERFFPQNYLVYFMWV